MIADRGDAISRLDRYALSAARLLVRATITLQILRFHSSSWAQRRAIAIALELVESFAGIVGLIRHVGESLAPVSPRFRRPSSGPVFEEAVGAFCNWAAICDHLKKARASGGEAE